MTTTQQVIVVTTSAQSTPVTGNLTTSGVSGTFVPELGRDVYITLTGTWVGTVQLQRSTDGGVTWNNITVGGGSAWGRYTANCDEVVTHPTDAASTYRLNWTRTSGTLSYRLAQ